MTIYFKTNVKEIDLENRIKEFEKIQEEYNYLLEFLLKIDEPIPFLQCWMEGDWDSIKKEWPEFKGFLG